MYHLSTELFVAFRCTVQQTALRRTMLDLFAYCPNAPPCMMTPPPSERHVTGYSEQQVREMLPKPELVDVFIGDVMMLAGDDVPAAVSIVTCSVWAGPADGNVGYWLVNNSENS